MTASETFEGEVLPYSSALARLGVLAIEASSINILLPTALALMSDALEADQAEVLELSPGGESLTLLSASAPGAPAGPFPSGPGSLAGLALQSGATALAADLGPGSPLPDAHLAARGFASGASILVRGPGRPFGVLGIYARRSRRLFPAQVHFAEAAAGIVATALARLKAESAMLERERQVRAVFDNALDALLIADDAGRCIDANPAALKVLGLSRRELLEKSPLDFLAWNDFLKTGRASGELHLSTPGRPARAVEFAAVADILPGRHLAVLRDVTERKQMQARLALADRLVSVGTLTAGLAHELNNPLAYVAANASFMDQALSELLCEQDPERVRSLAGEMKEALSELRDGSERMREIIRDLKTFSRPDDARIGPVDVRPILESCAHAAGNEIRQRARLVRELGPVPPVLGSLARLGQVFLNLLINAAQAIPEGDAARHEIRMVTRTLADGRAAVEIRDTGCGMSAENLRRVFDPFFTTKPIGVGIGLGLSVCHGIVVALGGEMEVESELGRGSVFRVLLLPACAAEITARSVSSVNPVDRRARILVVDDEPFVGASIRRALSREHDVVVVSSARQALDLVRGGAEFDVLLSDLLMPEMSGMELYHELGRTAPGLADRMLFLTGGAFTPAARTFLEEEQVACLEKPFDIPVLQEAVRRRMSQVRPS